MFKIPSNVSFVMETLINNGHKAYLVGGCVRDMLMGKTPTDFDITTSAFPKEITALFEKTIPTGIKHGTVTVIVDSVPIEVTTFRTENGYSDSRHPDGVNFVRNLPEDLCRRDFTVNAIAYNKCEGLIDLYGGIADIENKILRTVGDAKTRFSEDALRILRLFRFASTLDFSIEQNTLTSALECANLLETISCERIFAELKKAVMGDNFKVLEALILSGGLSFLNLTKTPDFEKINGQTNPLIRLYLSISTDTLMLLRPSNKEREFFCTFDYLSLLPTPKNERDIKEMLNTCDSDILKAFFEYKGLDITLIDKVLQSHEPYKISHLKIDGKTLLELGFKGEKIGEILEYLRKTVIKEPQKNTKENLLKEIP
ncbi:MAG: CCA tRNA nucleotidyltransferase [Clostridia bacterium]|nr:CCA tRNA nucleotidyltransferase [Clostridia bacterium]